MIRVFLVDNHALVRSGLGLVLAAEPDLEIVGEARDGPELLAQLPTTPADVVLLGVNSPDRDGIETIRQLRAPYPALRVLVLSMVEQADYIWQLLAAGAQGCLLKSAGTAEIITGLRTVAAAGQFLSAAIGLSALRELHENGPQPAAAPTPPPGSLSGREVEVLQLLAEGLTTGKIADALFVSKRTIETHRQNILEKMQAKNTASLIRQALQTGLID